jgi:hypothetical protein
MLYHQIWWHWWVPRLIFGRGIHRGRQRVEVKWGDFADRRCFSTWQSKQDGETPIPPQSRLCCWRNYSLFDCM